MNVSLRTRLGIWPLHQWSRVFISHMQPATNYDTLRSWYLAKLRKSAIEAQVSGQLTPSALIAADREVIEKLIAERAESEDQKSRAKAGGSNALIFSLCIWAYLILAVLVSLFLFCLADPSIYLDVLLVTLNPANIMAAGHVLPSPMVLLVVQFVLYVYPVTIIPFAFFKKGNR